MIVPIAEVISFV